MAENDDTRAEEARKAHARRLAARVRLEIERNREREERLAKWERQRELDDQIGAFKGVASWATLGLLIWILAACLWLIWRHL